MKKRLIWPLLIGLSLSKSALAQNFSPLDELPELGDRSRTVLTPTKEKELSLSFFRAVHKQREFIQDPVAYHYLQTLMTRLLGVIETTKTFNAFIVNDNTINAFAGPGGHIGTHTGFWLASQSESELAAVLAHEISHVTQNHIARQFERQSQMSIPNLAALVASILIATKDPQAGNAAISAVVAGNTQSFLNFSRQFEREADRVGITMLSNANFNPYGMPAFFERLYKRYQFYPKPPAFLLTHPVTEERIADAKLRLQGLPPQTYKESLAYQLVKVRLNILLSKNNRQITEVYRKAIARNSMAPVNLPNQYGYILGLMKGKHYQQALEQVKDLRRHYPEQIHFNLVEFEIYSGLGAHKTALAGLKGMHDIFPNNHAVAMTYVKALENAEQYAKAIPVLHAEHKKYPYNTHIYERLHTLQGKAGFMIDALLAHADYHELLGRFDEALKLLKQAQTLSKDKQFYQQKISARIEQINKLKEEE